MHRIRLTQTRNIGDRGHGIAEMKLLPVRAGLGLCHSNGSMRFRGHRGFLARVQGGGCRGRRGSSLGLGQEVLISFGDAGLPGLFE